MIVCEQLDWQNNMIVITSTIDSAMSGFDPASNSFIILMHLTNRIGNKHLQLRPFAFALYHFYCLSVGVCALRALISRVRARGYVFVSAEQCWGEASRSKVPLNPATDAWRRARVVSEVCQPSVIQGRK